jgi:acetylornithine deacetylase
MKGFLGTAMSLAGEMGKLKRPIHFALSYDEEVGCAGAPVLLADLAAANIKPALAIIGEPTNMAVVGAHKGGVGYWTRCVGHEGHSSAPHKGASAVMMAGDYLVALDRVAHELESDRDPNFEPPYSTALSNLISGGTAQNILAREVNLSWECRTLPGRDGIKVGARMDEIARDEILPKYNKGAPDAAFQTKLMTNYPGLALDPDSAAVALARELSGANAVETVAYGTEAGLFQQAGIAAVVCGPGSIEQAHKPDEFVKLSELDACGKFLRRLIAKASA